VAPVLSETPVSSTNPLEDLALSIKQAATLLPAQGPITVFVFDNTLRALEGLPFGEALETSVDLYGCQPYLPEERYRQELARGRIKLDILTSVLEEDLGDRADDLIGLLGTRYHLRLAMLSHPLRTAPTDELRWIVAESDALRTFSPDVAPDVRARMIEETRRWIMRDYHHGRQEPMTPDVEHAQAMIGELVRDFSSVSLENWTETQWEEFTLKLLWKICGAGVHDIRSSEPNALRRPRHRDLLLEATGVDVNEAVHDVLIRFTSAYLDQGYSQWRLPHRDDGYYRAFIELFSQPGGMLSHAMKGLKKELRRLDAEKIGPLESINESLNLLGVEADERKDFVTRSLLSLSGWAGMIWQMETNAEWAVWPAPQGSLIGFLAIRLVLERIAAANVAREELGYDGPLSALRSTLMARAPRPKTDGGLQRAFIVFQLAQTLGWKPEYLYRLPPNEWRQILGEVESFSALDRRRLFQITFERSYRNDILDAIAGHRRSARIEAAVRRQATPVFQVVTCIDDREESFRRHLEESEPKCETFALAGFFGIAMYYRGLADAHWRPLCPVIIKPKHYVEERPSFSFQQLSDRRAKTRKMLGAASHRVHRGSRSLLWGAVTAMFGSLASFPLVTRILLPRTTAEVRKMFDRFVQPPPMTQLILERTEADPGPDRGQVGYSVAEMANVVEHSLRDIGLISGFSRLVMICGHGSSSLNNPHESAYNCGACSGGRGGPNARAFAQMANDPRVRRILADGGLEIPTTTYFLGGYHNTCTDDVEYFDLDRMPPTFQDDFNHLRQTMNEARQRNAHERCRRFQLVKLDIAPEAALREVEGRAEDLSQARPEYDHATNAICVVGRRDLTRGLFLDRRSLLASYDPTQDDEESKILIRILQAAIPVCAGISLQYYFSTVDTNGLGCGSKLPHNITSLLGVMEGAASDLRPGLSQQKVEIHEPMRILFVIDSPPESMERVMKANPYIAQLCRNEWIQLATVSPDSGEIRVFTPDGFVHYEPAAKELPKVPTSVDWYRGWRDNLGCAEIENGCELADHGQPVAVPGDRQ
jgi:uncharacterized protein YbcC (UPF0753/DUF2309 family)